MEATEKKKTADILTEKSVWIRVGFIPFRVRPITLAQIFETGSFIENLSNEEIDIKKRINAISNMFFRYKDAKQLEEIFLICTFRTHFMRKLFGWYIRHNLRPKHLNLLIASLSMSLSANFFLTSIIFLRQMKPMTDPNPTTAPGQQWEE